MAVFRVEKTRDYTVMANHHLRNTELSLKAKGLLSLICYCYLIFTDSRYKLTLCKLKACVPLKC